MRDVCVCFQQAVKGITCVVGEGRGGMDGMDDFEGDGESVG